MTDTAKSKRITLRTLRQWAADHTPFPMLTCYDATTARHLWRGGVKCMLVGDTAAHVILGHDSTLPAPLDFMLQITAAVRRGAPDAFIMADMPFGSYQASEAQAVDNAVAFMTQAGADAVKLEVDASYARLVRKLSSAGVPVVAHLGSRPQQLRVQGQYRADFRTHADVDRLVRTARLMIENGAVMILLEAAPEEAAEPILRLAVHEPTIDEVRGDFPPVPRPVPVIGCGAGPHCHGHVVVLQDLLGLTDWRPPFAPKLADLGDAIQQAASEWTDLVESKNYLKDDHPYKMP